MYEDYLTGHEKLLLSLRALWTEEGYSFFRMRNFEEYDFYAKNKDFLDSKNIISFRDIDGTLLALKPDVTLSLVKRANENGKIEKKYYSESVYRVPPFSDYFKEITQTGLECLGPLSEDDIISVVSLANRSLKKVSSTSILTISHMAVLDELTKFLFEDEKKEILSLVSKKNISEIKEFGDGDERRKECALSFLQLIDGKKTNNELISILEEKKIENKVIAELLNVINLDSSIVLDFSFSGAMGYYNGIVMKGYIEKLPTPILSGGEYDILLRRMGKKENKAIGFAFYLNELEELIDD